MIQDRKITAYSKTHAMLATEPNDTLSADQLKAWWDTAPEEARVAINGIVDDIIADYATKSELSGVQLGQISPGTITPTQLSFDPATQAELNAHTGATTGIHGATSAATANTLAFRDASGRLQVAAPSAVADATTKGYVDAKFQTGAYTGDGAATRTISLGVTPKLVLVLGRWSSDGAGAKRWVFLYATGGKPTDTSVFTAEMHTTNGGFLITAGTLNISGEAYDYFWWG